MADGTQTTTGNLAVITAAVNEDGGAGNDRLDAGLGPDTMAGGGGNDSYVVFDPRAVLTELVTDAGNDILLLGPSFVLEEEQSIETIAFIFDAEITRLDLTGNELTRFIRGNSGANILSTGAGPGPDTFVFFGDYGPTNIARITDFSGVDEQISFDATDAAILPAGALAAAAFIAHTTGLAQDGSDRIIFQSNTGSCFSTQMGWVEQRRYSLRN